MLFRNIWKQVIVTTYKQWLKQSNIYTCICLKHIENGPDLYKQWLRQGNGLMVLNIIIIWTLALSDINNGSSTFINQWLHSAKFALFSYLQDDIDLVSSPAREISHRVVPDQLLGFVVVYFGLFVFITADEMMELQRRNLNPGCDGRENNSSAGATSHSGCCCWCSCCQDQETRENWRELDLHGVRSMMRRSSSKQHGSRVLRR